MNPENYLFYLILCYFIEIIILLKLLFYLTEDHKYGILHQDSKLNKFKWNEFEGWKGAYTVFGSTRKESKINKKHEAINRLKIDWGNIGRNSITLRDG